ncbi:MAG: S8 family serine peptidase, partial [Phycisphaerales bacterium]
MDYVIENDIKVSNNSWGGVGFSQSFHDVIEASQAIGHILVAAAGNDTANNDGTPHYPSSYDLPNIISVAATDNDDALASFSNWGLNSVDLGAPGIATYSTVLGADYAFLSGTSMASPHATGVVALIMSRSPQFTWQQVRDRILESVRPVASLDGITITGGVLDAVSALGDCNANGIDDALDIAGGTSEDCTGNGIPDECEPDCNTNGIADSCDIAFGTSDDCDGMGRPDECEADCNTNGIADQCDIAEDTSGDCNFNGVPDECEPGGMYDCNSNGNPDLCDLFQGLEEDCNENNVPDTCDALVGTSEDCNGNLIPDECEMALEILMSGDASQAFVDSIKELGHSVIRVAGDYSSFPLDLSPYDVLMLVPGGVPDISPWFYEIVDEFVEAGGGLIRIQDPPGYAPQFRGLASPVLDAVGWDLRANTQVVNASSPVANGLASTSALAGYSASYTLRPEADVVIAWDDGEPMTVAYA